jgi:hypothetical protein
MISPIKKVPVKSKEKKTTKIDTSNKNYRLVKMSIIPEENELLKLKADNEKDMPQTT